LNLRNLPIISWVTLWYVALLVKFVMIKSLY